MIRVPNFSLISLKTHLKVTLYHPQGYFDLQTDELGKTGEYVARIKARWFE